MANNYQLQTLARALDVLELLERTPEPLSLTEIADSMGEATAIVYRILHTLEARAYLYRRPQDKRYSYTGRSTGAGAVSRAIDVLQAAADNVPGGASVEQLAAQVGLDQRVTEEILVPLSEKGLMERKAEGESWYLSHAVMELARPFLNSDDVLLRIRPMMERLHVETGETVSLFHRAGDKQVVTSALPSAHPVRYALEVGSAFPLYLGAAGKAMMAFLPEAEAESLIKNHEMASMTRYVPKTAALRKELKTIRQRGFALSNGERVEGASAVAIPVQGDDGYPVAVLGLMMPSFRTSDDALQRLGEQLVEELRLLRIPSARRDS
ncbi:IclR family transcriptional regulator domain-containing protein [Alloalcanivorax mobilis]|uniref:IclR family transcriptional regulator domain-containing protein n=1 Tax=Alloalcanivorax mobilis TaxID=2019569 RepID=UPI000B5B0D58|nr:IclR family transcriptional regulator C-terminal domain-containing protein [Alloalcanivorax mobilis]ASK36117.1 IclR family transcriptional regulator [Alcanivorax sp. N3-2A]|tara:strand:- start:17395 stop:18366 length:972 start_codon:yes stop_codon:yes gene_type:complete